MSPSDLLTLREHLAGFERRKQVLRIGTGFSGCEIALVWFSHDGVLTRRHTHVYRSGMYHVFFSPDEVRTFNSSRMRLLRSDCHRHRLATHFLTERESPLPA